MFKPDRGTRSRARPRRPRAPEGDFMELWNHCENPYPFVPNEVLEAAPSVRASLPNKYCDPRIAAQLYDEVFDEYRLCDELGIHIVTNEHHAGINNLWAASPVITGIVARMTRNVRILSLGTLITVRPDPVRVAEEYATIDVLSRGRLEIGFVKSGATEMVSGDANPMRIREREWEAIDLIEKALTTHDGPFSWEGKFFIHSHVNIWPRMNEELSLPAERPVMRRQRLFDEVDRLPFPLADAHRIGVARDHLGRAGFDKADLEPTAGEHVDRCIFLGHSHRVGPHRDQRAEREDTHIPGHPRDDPGDDRAGRPQIVDAGMMLVGDDVNAELVAQPIFVEDLVIKLRRDPGIAVLVRQAGPHRGGRFQHLVRNEWVRVLAVVPQFHKISFRRLRPARPSPGPHPSIGFEHIFFASSRQKIYFLSGNPLAG